ncbi:oligopeptide transport system permease protein [[Synechococcus] sp. NIES-970]|uniref:ABC transporter permease n=1 Tax=Picosynechococcus sp. NKBG15041c TaxID=1407650 RepID=UPI00040F6AA7|nr:ABC transporter permease [Picosynechococcus sp. NKBG15041c]BAW96747.1 oligopeptide transport system permease protein [[Synechococcus] sp. NIES-970]
MDWWRKLRNNPLARVGAIVLISFYVLVIGADFFAPYNPYASQLDGSLMPPTAIHWPNGTPHVYPTSQGPTDLDTGDRQLIIDAENPQPLRLFVKGDAYQFLQIKLPVPPSFEERVIFPGIRGDRHLFGVVGDARFNLLGTDEQGRDQFSRLLHGGRISLFIGLVGITISFPLGMIIGGISGYFGGWIDAVLMRFVEVLMTIPGIYLLVSLAAILPASLTSAQRFLLIVLITSFISWSGLARVIRGQVLSIKNQEFVQAAQATGGRSLYIITRHILPQTASYAIISATLAVPGFIIAESVLSLIGLGIQQPDPSWGNLLSLGTNASILVLQPWLVWSPAVLIIITVLAFNLLGDGLRDALDPKSLQSRRD